MFSIKASSDFYRKCLDDYSAFIEHPEDAGLAINCALSAYHLTEWIWGDWLGKDFKTWGVIKVRDKDSFVDWAEANCPFFATMRDLANGSKHFNRKTSESTAAFAHTVDVDGNELEIIHLLVEVTEFEIRSFEDMLKYLLEFWHDFFVQHSPCKDLPTPNSAYEAAMQKRVCLGP